MTCTSVVALRRCSPCNKLCLDEYLILVSSFLLILRTFCCLFTRLLVNLITISFIYVFIKKKKENRPINDRKQETQSLFVSLLSEGAATLIFSFWPSRTAHVYIALSILVFPG